MSYFGVVTIKDQFDWEKKVELEKPLIMIGSAPSNDVVLPEGHGGGVAPIHLQLISSNQDEYPFRLLNLSELEVTVYDRNMLPEEPLLPGSVRMVNEEQTLQIGDFVLSLQLVDARFVVNEQRTENIGMKLELPDVSVRPGEKLSGLISVKNFGGDRRCQFELDLIGIADDCYQIAPAPLLYPGAEEKLLIRFFHHKTHPQAGLHRFILSASASTTYPTEQIVIQQDIEFQPMIDVDMSIEDEAVKDMHAAPLQTQDKAALVFQTEQLSNEGEQPESDIENIETPDIEPETFVEDLEIEQVQEIIEETSIPQPVIESWDDEPDEVQAEELEIIVEEEPVLEPELELDSEDAPEIMAEPEALIAFESESEPEQEIAPELGAVQEDQQEEDAADDNEESWWEDDSDNAYSYQSSLNNFNRHMRSRLSRDQIQVIKAGQDDQDQEEGDRA